MLTNEFTAQFAAFSGSILGRDHAHAHRGCQDACSLHSSPAGAVLVVADGCSSGPFTEVGAHLGAAWIARHALAYDVAAPGALDALAGDLLTYLQLIAAGLAPGHDGALARAVHDYLLFGFLAAVVTPDTACVFGAGDGLFAIDGAETILDPGPDNAPSYVAYALLGRPSPMRMHATRATASLRSIVLATDGAIPLTRAHGSGELEEIATNVRYTRNASLLRKRLVVLGALEKRLHDDAAIAVLTRREAAS